jgi:broad specificity phosphatase PhoE
MARQNEEQSQPHAATHVWLLRHAETANPAVFHGAESDIGLSERGRRLAERLAPVLAELRPAAVISSAMRRAQETAVPIAAACGLVLQLEPELHERRVGALSGTSFDGSNGVWADTLRRWMAGETGYAPPGAESFDAIRARVVPVFERLATQFVGRSYVIVAHGVVCKVLLMSLNTGLSPADWKRIGPIHNLALHELTPGPAGWRILRYNELHQSLRED